MGATTPIEPQEHPMTAPTTLSRLTLGIAPDSWGVWFPEDPRQVTWRQYLDEVPRAGFVWTELGPQGFLPQDPQRLRDELDQRGLKVSGGTVFAGLHRGKEALDKAIEDFSREARLLTAVGARYLIHLPEQYTDMHTGRAVEAGQLDPEHWTNLTNGTNELGRVLHEEFGVELVFHPHADTHVDTQDRVERFLTDTDPRYVNLCLDTGHISYCAGSNIEIIQGFPDRIGYIHLKQVDPEVRRRVEAEKLSMAEAVPLGVMVEPPYGEPAMPPLLDALAVLDKDLFCVIEQDLYPVTPDVPLPIAARTAGYFTACGLGPVRRWPYRNQPA
jgi:inosose dehydratase